MTDEPTAPMDQQGWQRLDSHPEEQKTELAGQDFDTPPTIPISDQPPQPGPGFVRTVPADTPTPAPFRPVEPAPPPMQPAGSQPQAGPSDQTMVMRPEAQLPPVFAWLAVIDAPDRNSVGTVHTLDPDTTTIGRVPGNSIAVADDFCSAQHARIRVERGPEDEPAIVLYDMGSRNGTYVGDRETYKDDESQVYRHELHDGDFVLIGDTTLVFKIV